MKSFAKEWWKLDALSHPTGRVWRGTAPPGTELLLSFIIRDRLNTTSRLKRVKVVNEEATALLPFCEIEDEIIRHLLLHCKFSRRIWMKVNDGA